MSEQYFDRLLEAIEEYCIKNNIHTACFYCKNQCHNEYTYWSGQMPNDIYCDKYDQVDEV